MVTKPPRYRDGRMNEGPFAIADTHAGAPTVTRADSCHSARQRVVAGADDQPDPVSASGLMRSGTK